MPARPGSMLFSDQDRAEISKLRKANAELEIIVKEQATKIDRLREEIEAELRSKYGTPFDQTVEYSEMKEEVNELREAITEKDDELHNARSLISELRASVRKTELAQFEEAESHIQERTRPQTPLVHKNGSTPSLMTAASTGTSSKSVLDMSSKIRQLEMMLQNERKVRLDEQERYSDKITKMEAELTIAKAELSVSKLSITK